MKCRLCNISTDFGKSHIIPESFFLHNRAGDEKPVIASNSDIFHPKIRPIGEYDKKILCKGCEKVFNPWDDYGKRLLLDYFNNYHEIRENNEILGYRIDSYDYKKLKLFLISILWRAGISGQSFFQKILLGPHENILREMICNNNPGKCDDYAIQIFRFSEISYTVPILMPLEIRTSYGFRYYRIYLGSYFVDIKVDKRSTPKKYATGIIEENTPLIIVCMNIKKMNEYRILEEIANSPNNEKLG